MLNSKQTSLFRFNTAQIPNSSLSAKISKATPSVSGEVTLGGSGIARRNVTIPFMTVQNTKLKPIGAIDFSEQGKPLNLSTPKQIDQIESDPSLKQKTQQLFANTKSCSLQKPKSFNQMAPMAQLGSTQLGINMNSHQQHSIPKGNRSGLMNLQMNVKQKSNTQDFQINRTIDDTQKASKQVFIKDNFIDSKFQDEQYEEPDLKQWKFQIPIWQNGLDRVLTYPKQMLDHKIEDEKDTIIRSMNAFDPMMTPLGKKTIMKLQKELQTKKVTVDQMYDSMRDNLSTYFDLPKGTGIFFAPSEASAQYLVLMIASGFQTCHDDRFEFKSIISGQMRDQIDQSILIAAKGQYICTEKIPNEQWLNRQPLKETWVPGLPRVCSAQLLESSSDGVKELKDYQKTVQNLISGQNSEETANQLGKFIIMQSMGALDKHMEAMWWNNLDGLSFDDEIRVYNHLEGRVDKKQLHKHLENGDLFVFNGTNYYRGPLQCAAIIVPPNVMESLQITEKLQPEYLRNQWTLDGQAPSSLNCFFGKNDIPKELKIWRENIDDNLNPGLALRWSAAIASMQEISSFNDEMINQLERSWELQMTELIKYFPILSNVHDFNTSNDKGKIKFEQPSTTISIAVKSQSIDEKNEAWLNQQDLGLLTKLMEQDMSEKIDWNLQQQIYEDSQVDVLSCMDLQELKKIASSKILLTAQPKRSTQGNKSDLSNEYALQICLSYDDIAEQLNNSVEKQTFLPDFIMFKDVYVIYKLVMLAYALPQLKAETSFKFQRDSIKKNFLQQQLSNLEQGGINGSKEQPAFNSNLSV